MGWIYSNRNTEIPLKAFLQRRFDYEDETGTWKVLDCAVVKFWTAYLAIRCFDKQTQVANVIGVVCQLDYQGYRGDNFGYKAEEDNSGPYLCEAPERILRLLTPTSNQNAINWRDECWETIKYRKSQAALKKTIKASRCDTTQAAVGNRAQPR